MNAEEGDGRGYGGNGKKKQKKKEKEKSSEGFVKKLNKYQSFDVKI